MFESSIKEYELLTKEVSEIKACITRYIGFIIGANGLVFVLVKFFNHGTTGQSNELKFAGIELGLNNFVLPFIGISVLSSLYFLINYKFNSHNRHVGYLQLLSQEMKHISTTNFWPIRENDKLQPGLEENVANNLNCPNHIMSWQYIMSRFNSRIQEKEFNSNDFGNLDFRFALSRKKKYDNLDSFVGNLNIIESFLNEIVWKKLNFYSHKRKLYNKYITKSWRYPIYVYILALVQVIVISVFTYLGNQDKPIHFNLTWGIIVVVIWIYFTKSLFQVMGGNKSIDYYCWQFLPYRVQMLNSYEIRPIYHSTLFARYFKAGGIIKRLKAKLVEPEFEERFNQIKNEYQKKGDTNILSNFIHDGSKEATIYNTILKLKLGWELNDKEKSCLSEN